MGVEVGEEGERLWHREGSILLGRSATAGRVREEQLSSRPTSASKDRKRSKNSELTSLLPEAPTLRASAANERSCHVERLHALLHLDGPANWFPPILTTSDEQPGGAEGRAARHAGRQGVAWADTGAGARRNIQRARGDGRPLFYMSCRVLAA